jgi:hypothetical protein
MVKKVIGGPHKALALRQALFVDARTQGAVAIDVDTHYVSKRLLSWRTICAGFGGNGASEKNAGNNTKHGQRAAVD